MPDEYPDQTDARPSTFEPAIDAELSVLASIETHYWDELTKLERSACRFRLETTFVSGLRQSAGWRGSLTSYGWPSFTKRGRCGRCSA